MNRMFQQIIPHRKCLVPLQFVRFKGHNKFSNIKATKESKDLQFSRLAYQYSREIMFAVKNNGMEKNPEKNKKLASTIKEAYAQGIMKTTIDNAIRKAEQNTDEEGLFEARGPGRVGLMIEMVGKNKGNMRTELNTIFKKSCGMHDIGIANMFERKGVIVISKEESSLDADQLEEDAIEFGAEDIEEFDEVFTLTCSPLDFADVLSKLKEKYQISHGKVEYVPNIYVEMTNKKDKALLKLLLNTLEDHPAVTDYHHNADI